MARRDVQRPGAGDAAAGAARMRFDKWLWAARFYKTRALAAQAIESGQARLAGERVKPAHALRVGDSVCVRKQGTEWTVEVAALDERRGPATQAAALYRETAESLARREDAAAFRRAAAATVPTAPGRPTKRNRRRLEDFLNEP